MYSSIGVRKTSAHSSDPNPTDALHVVVPDVRVPVMRQVPDRALGPPERFDLGAVHGERRPGGREVAVRVRRRDLQVHRSREALVRVRLVVGHGGRR